MGPLITLFVGVMLVEVKYLNG